MKTGYYPGCSLSGTAKEYDAATRRSLAAIGIEVQEVPDWNCCGATPAHVTDPDLALALPARILALTQEAGMDEITAPCAACFNRLAVTNHQLRDAGLRQRIDELTGRQYGGNVKVTPLPDLALRAGEDAIKAAVRRPLEGLKVACYYGCLLVRPQEATGASDVENPQSMDTIMGALGAEPVGWPHKTECCGGNHSLGRSDIVLRLVSDLVAVAVDHGADCFATACPLCHGNLDMRQDLARKELGQKLPVFHFTQLMGIAFGLSDRDVGLRAHLVDPRPLLKAKIS